MICLYCGARGDKGGARTFLTGAMVQRLGKARQAWPPEGVRIATKNGKKSHKKKQSLPPLGGKIKDFPFVLLFCITVYYPPLPCI